MPWQAWWFLRPMEPRVVAGALVHDLLYLRRGQLEGDGQRIVVTRFFADLAFFVLMCRSGLEPYRAWVAFVAVQVFSGPLFRRGRPLPEPSAAALEAEALLVAEAWQIVRDRAHLAGFSLLAFILAGFLLLGGGALAWVLTDGWPVTLPVRFTVFGTGAVLLITALSVMAASWWVVRKLGRRMRRAGAS